MFNDNGFISLDYNTQLLKHFFGEYKHTVNVLILWVNSSTKLDINCMSLFAEEGFQKLYITVKFQKGS